MKTQRILLLLFCMILMLACSSVVQAAKKEKKSTDVTTAEDRVDAYDGVTSLREAIAYAEKTKKTVTFEGYSKLHDFIELKKPFVISGHVKLDGYMKIGKTMLTQIISASLKKQSLFTVKKGATLSLRGLSISKRNGYEVPLIDNKGGSITIDRCEIKNATNFKNGGAICSSGGKVRIRNSIVEDCEAANGGVVYAVNTRVSILNSYFSCNFMMSEKGDGAILYTKGGIASVVSCTMFYNGSGDYEDDGDDDPSMPRRRGAVLYGDKNLRVLNCVFVDNSSKKDIGGQASVYGCFVRSLASTVNKDTLTRKGTRNDLFVSDEDNGLYFDVGENPYMDDYPNSNLFYFMLGQKDVKGCYIRVKDGKLQYSADEKTWLKTDITADFPESAYKKDIYGAKRTYQYGAFATLYKDPAKKKIGRTPVRLSIKQNAGFPIETSYGNVMADAMLAATGADVALFSNRRMKASIPRGNVTYGQLRKCFPTVTYLGYKTLTGEELLSVLEQSLELTLQAQKKNKNASEALQIGGVTLQYLPSAPKGERIKDILVGGEQWEKDRDYRLCFSCDAGFQDIYPELEYEFDEWSDEPCKDMDALQTFLQTKPKGEIAESATSRRWIEMTEDLTPSAS